MAPITAGIDVDGPPLGKVIGEDVTQPFMFLVSDHSRESDAESHQVRANFRSIFDRTASDRRLRITIRGANHFGFSDDGSMLKSPLVMRALRTLGISRIDGRSQLAITTHYISSFFDVYLKAAPASVLESQREYPEIQYLD